MSNPSQNRNQVILERLLAEVKRNPGFKFHNHLSVSLECLCDEIHDEGLFGNDGERDPRGDFRYGAWNVDRVQGVDG